MTLRDLLVRTFPSIHYQQFFGSQGHPFVSGPISTAQEKSVNVKFHYSAGNKCLFCHQNSSLQ